MPAELPSAPVSIGGVLDSAFRLYRSTFGHTWLLMLIAAVPGIAFGVLEAMVLPLEAQPAAASPDEAMARLVRMYSAFLSPPIMAGALVVSLCGYLAYGAVIVTEKTLSQGQPITFSQALGASLRGLPAAIGAGIVASLIIGFGIVLLVIPGIYFAGKLMLWLTAVYVDRAGPLESIGISWRLTRKRWWRGVVTLTVAVILAYIFILAVGVVAGLVAGLLGAIVPAGATGRLVLISAISQAGNIVVLPLLTAVLVVLYNDFKLRSEGGDLAARAAVLGHT
jgi:hypothetical protein